MATVNRGEAASSLWRQSSTGDLVARVYRKPQIGERLDQWWFPRFEPKYLEYLKSATTDSLEANAAQGSAATNARCPSS